MTLMEQLKLKSRNSLKISFLHKKSGTKLLDLQKIIRDLLEQCTTLKQYRSMAAAESLVDSEKLSQMHVKITRKQRAEQIKQEINSTQL